MITSELIDAARTARHRWQLLMWLERELSWGFRDRRDDPPLLLPGEHGGTEPPARDAIDDVHGDLVRAAAQALEQYEELRRAVVVTTRPTSSTPGVTWQENRDYKRPTRK